MPPAVLALIRAYRVRGHRAAALDPLGLPVPPVPELDPAHHGLSEEDLDRVVVPGPLVHARGDLSLRQLVERLRETYCRSIGVQSMHIDEIEPRLWLEERIETSRNRLVLAGETQRRILRRLSEAVAFEGFVRRKYVGAKTFSLEGCETLIPLLDLAFEAGAALGLERVVLAMAHRGRLNVLANVVGKSPREIFREFEDRDPEPRRGAGDVKYHLGHSGDWTCASGRRLRVQLCFNPSHLEFVNPVALGRLRAWQDRCGDAAGRRGMAVLIHGDAAFAGQGVVQETLNLSGLEPYDTGGALHVVVNNQLGYTTPPHEGRSSPYATDVARMLQSPILHVNGEDPVAVAQAVRLAVDFRWRFRRDVVVDMYGYRRHGHNEGDEPAYTQPLMYAAIERRPPVRDAYLARLLASGGVTQEQADAIEAEALDRLTEELSAARGPREARAPGPTPRPDPTPHEEPLWRSFTGGPAELADEPDTALPAAHLAELLVAQTRLPADFHPHPKIERAMDLRRKMAAGERALDWSAAESLAFASLAVEGVRVRLTGQDSARGTFSQRHAELHDVQDGRVFVPLRHVAPGQASVDIRNSPLSETAVMGFEYGYSLGAPDALVLWEAQFGDFVNAAQVVVDQFLASGEDKWRQLSGLVLLLPHGFDGQGPEHSSARLERFLVLAAEDNLQVAQPTTPAQYFHLLRRQALRRWRKPLVVLTPKSLLRGPRATSTLDELASGRFRPVLDSDAAGSAGDDAPKGGPGSRRDARVLLCSGKVFYDLAERREEAARGRVRLLRLEQLHPFPERELREALAPHADGTPLVWVQEEPLNMGAAGFLRLRFGERAFGRLPFSVVAREESASPATGSRAAHRLEQAELVGRALGS